MEVGGVVGFEPAGCSGCIAEQIWQILVWTGCHRRTQSSDLHMAAKHRSRYVYVPLRVFSLYSSDRALLDGHQRWYNATELLVTRCEFRNSDVDASGAVSIID